MTSAEIAMFFFQFLSITEHCYRFEICLNTFKVSCLKAISGLPWKINQLS